MPYIGLNDSFPFSFGPVEGIPAVDHLLREAAIFLLAFGLFENVIVWHGFHKGGEEFTFATVST